MLSNQTWNALSANGKRAYAPYIGKRIKDTETGKIGLCTNYTLSGQLMTSSFIQWAKKCEILED